MKKDLEEGQNLTEEQQKLVDGYNEIKGILGELSIRVQNNEQVELDSIEKKSNALQEEIRLYKERNNIVNTRAYGATPLVNATAKYNTLKERSQPYIGQGSTVVKEELAKVEAAYNTFAAKQREFAAQNAVNPEQKSQLNQLKDSYNECARALKKIIDESDKLAASGDNLYTLDKDTSLQTFNDRANALKDYVQTTYGASAAIGKLNGDATKLTFTIKNGDGTITNMAASLNRARTAIISTTGETEKAATSFGRFFDSVKSKLGGLATYAAARFGIDEVIQVVRQGVRYIREIDIALTELKKVTNETDGTYDAFLQSMSKTAGVVGSTVSELTTMAAEWARLNI